MNVELVSGVLQAVLMAVLPALAVALLRWLLTIGRRESQKLDQQTMATLRWLAGMAVKAAEQSKLAGLIEDKKQYALDFLEAWFKRRGIALDLDTLSLAIEAAVIEQFPK
jgi:hypothetical protein